MGSRMLSRFILTFLSWGFLVSEKDFLQPACRVCKLTFSKELITRTMRTLDSYTCWNCRKFSYMPNLTSEAARLSPWQPAALQALHQCARPTKDNKKPLHTLETMRTPIQTSKVGSYWKNFTGWERQVITKFFVSKCCILHGQEETWGGQVLGLPPTRLPWNVLLLRHSI